MIRNMKLTGLVVITALAIGSIGASTATADEFKSEAASGELLGAGESEVFKVQGGEIKCTTAKYAGAVSSTSFSSFSMSATYSGCTFAGLAATINMNGCTYKTNINTSAGNTTGTVDVVCPAGKEITVTAPSVGTAKCIVHVPAQTGLSTVSYSNVGAGTTKEVHAHISITNEKFSQTAGTAETGNCATADNQTNGTYTKTIHITGWSLFHFGWSVS